MSNSPNPYKILGVKENATDHEIKNAYRRLAKVYHPDRCGGDKAKEAKFKEISSAYSVLGTPEKRQEYDAMKNAGFNGQGFSGANADFGDVFSSFFSGNTGNRGRNSNFSFSFGGAENPFGGFNGDGFPREVRRQRSQNTKTAAKKEKKIKAKDGSPLLLRGSHVYSEARLSLDQAILGCVYEVATLDGKAKLKIPAGTSSGVKMRLKNKGARGFNNKRGDHYITIHVDVPKNIDDKAEELFIKFMQRVKKKSKNDKPK